MKKNVLIIIIIFLFIVLIVFAKHNIIEENKGTKAQEEEKYAQSYLYEKYKIEPKLEKSITDYNFTGPFGNEITTTKIMTFKYNENNFYVITKKNDDNTYNIYDNYQFDEIKNDLKEFLSQKIDKEILDIDLGFEETYIGLNNNLYEYNGLVSEYYNRNKLESVLDFLNNKTYKMSLIIYSTDDIINNIEKINDIKNQCQLFSVLEFKNIDSYNNYKEMHPKGFIFTMYSNSISLYFEKNNFEYVNNYYISDKTSEINSLKPQNESESANN